MSAKWHRSKAWDDRNLRGGALWPVKFVLRAFSSIWLAVLLLSMVIIYAILASVPIGMIAQIPTWIVTGATAIGTVALFAGISIVLWRVGTRSAGRPIRFAGSVLTALAFGALGAWVWWHEIWPILHYDPATGRGLLFFAEFCDRYRATTLRRLPGMEMSELEFYDWWPLRVILLAFVVNMIVATVRRIEFDFKRVGVLTVHSGIVTIALGSIYYNGLKKEGDTLLISGQLDENGNPAPGPAQNVFYDNTRLSLYVGQQLGYEQRPIEDVPRYNNYALDAFEGESALTAARRERPWEIPDASPEYPGGDRSRTHRTLDLPVMDSPLGIVDPDVKFRIVGYASYAEPTRDWRRVDLGALTSIPGSFRANPLRIVYLVSDLPNEKGVVDDRPAFSFILLPRIPSERISEIGGQLAVEYSLGMSDTRWSDLTEPIAPGSQHAVVVEIDPAADGTTGTQGQPSRAVIAADPANLPVTATVGGYTIEIRELLPQPPFPIITDGYQGATSSVAVVRVTPPKSANAEAKPFTRYAYHRFPEIDQEMLDEVNERGMPRRRNPDPAVRIGYIDASQVQVYFDEQPDGRVRSVVRTPGGAVRVNDPLTDSSLREFVPKLNLTLGPAWDHAEPVERPAPVAPERQDRSMIGTHDKAMLAVEVSSDSIKDRAGRPWKTIAWLPFTKYLGAGLGTERDVFLPDGRLVRLAFGRRQHPLPGFNIRLLDFQMIAYDHRGAPRDYQSLVRVEPTPGGDFEPFDHVTKLNAPLTAPFLWNDQRSVIANAFGRLASGLSPNQFKFSQAGWDQTGWQRTQQQADAGLAKRPHAAFTILGVGNNPGIHIIALGGTMMALGIPWAFYLKPYLVRLEKLRIQAQLAAGTYARPTRTPASSASGATIAAAHSTNDATAPQIPDGTSNARITDPSVAAPTLRSIGSRP